MKIRAVIIDDEQHSLHTTELMVNKNCSDVEIVALTDSPEKGIELIESIKPDLVFLDIAMPVINGFELLTRLTYKSFELVFTTAYNAYAIKAFKVNAIDYLLKPIEKDELVEAVKKVKSKIEKNEEYSKIDELLASLQKP